VILSVCQLDKTKTAETKITKLGIEIVRNDILPTKGQRLGLDGRVAGVRYAPLSSAPVVIMICFFSAVILY